MSSRRRMPPEYVRSGRSAASVSANRSSSSSARGAITARGSCPRIADHPQVLAAGEVRVDGGVLTGEPDAPRTACGLAHDVAPSTSARPASGCRIVASMRTAVVLPAPLGPRRPKTVPSSTSRSMPSRACSVAEPLLRGPRTTIAGSPMAMTLSRCERIGRRLRSGAARRTARRRPPSCRGRRGSRRDRRASITNSGRRPCARRRDPTPPCRRAPPRTSWRRSARRRARTTSSPGRSSRGRPSCRRASTSSKEPSANSRRSSGSSKRLIASSINRLLSLREPAPRIVPASRSAPRS